MSDFQRSALFPAQDALSLETKSALLASASLQDGLKDGLQPSQRASSAIVFIDANVTDYQSLAAGVTAGAEVHILDPMQDAVAQITNTLMGRTGIESLHIVSHGAAGSLQLGSDSLSLATLPGLAGQLQSWGTALTSDADIMLYGCNVAEGELGQAFVQIMSQLTGADVAASDDITGQGGDWMMEVHTGVIESSLAFSSSTTQSYGSTLAINVAVVDITGGTGTSNAGFISIRDQLNDDTYFDFNAVLVTPTQVDTVEELNAYNAVVIGNNGNVRPAYNAFASALRTWVEAGGGLVATGWTIFGANGNADINAVVPVLTGSNWGNILSSPIIPNSTVHPVTTGVSSFTTSAYTEYPPQSPPVDPGATVLATSSGGGQNQPVVVVGDKNAGRSVYLGPVYGGSNDQSGSIDLRSGNADRLLEQAVAWAGTRNVAKTGNEDTTITFSSTDFTNNFNNLTSLTVTSLPSNGTLQLNGSNVNVNQQITTANLGGLAFIPTTNFSGSASFNWTGTDGTQSRNGAVDIVVNPIADQPTLSIQAASGNEDTSIPLTISSALVDTDGSETLSIAISGLPQGATLSAGTNNNGTWTLTPAQLQGLSLTPAADYNGSFDLTVIATSTDGQSTAQNSQTLSVTVNPVNDAPSFTAADPVASNEDGGTQTITNWATFTAGPANEASQSATYNVSNISNLTLFEVAPNVAANGTLTYRAAPNAFGTSTFTVAVQDNGGTANGGVDTSATQTFTITVNGVNDAPTIVAPTSLTTPTNVARPITGITFSDIDAASGSITVAFAVPVGTLAATSASGVTVGGTPNALTLNGTIAEVNAFIAAGNLTYRGAAPGSQQLNVGITDGGNTGTGGPQTANTTVTLSIRSSNSDFNNDGQADLVWRNDNNNGVGVWLMNGTAINGVVGFPAPPSTDWYIGGIGDFDRDGDADIFWRSDVSGANGLWLMNGTAISSVVGLDAVTDTNWIMSGVGDFNGDGSLDMVWRNQVTGGNGIWLMNGTSITGVTGLPTFGSNAWAIQGIGDFNSDGQADIVWQNLNNGSGAAWLMNGISYSAAVVLPTLPPNWEIAGVTDFNNDGRSDLLVRNYGNGGGGGNGIWLMNGTAISSLVGLDAVPDTNWIVNV